MNIEMVPLEIIGLKSDLNMVIHSLRRSGCVQIDDLSEVTDVSARPLALDRETLRRQDETGFLVTRIEGLIGTLGSNSIAPPRTAPENCVSEARTGVEALLPRVQELTNRRDQLQAELALLPRYETTLRKLLPIIPSSAHQPGNVTVGILVNKTHVGVLDSVGRRIFDLTGGRAEVVASDVDATTRAMLVVFPSEYTNQCEEILGQEEVSRLRLPAQLGEGPPDIILAKLQQRVGEIPVAIKRIDQELDELADQWAGKLIVWRDILRDQIEMNSVLSRLGETDMTFVITGWVPARDFAKVAAALEQESGGAVFIQQLPLTPANAKRAPVCLSNPRAVKPFESLVNLFALPRYGHIDPTRLMAFFMPIFFGMILGDVGYGVLLLLLSLGLAVKFKHGVARDVVLVMAMGAAWSIIFGFLFGEFFGTLGEQVGMHALWFDRASPDYVFSLLVMTIGIGAAHITLGLFLGLWEAILDKSRSHLLERGGMLLGLIGLFFIVGVLANFLPENFMTPAIASLIVGIVLLSASLGWLGIIMGPIEFLGLIGNVLSYLRIAAIGLASIYLAKVANEMVGMVGNLIVGVILALLIHALNLVLGAFSPTIHSLRLHYVEFFRRFYEGGGRPYQPFKSNLSTDSW